MTLNLLKSPHIREFYISRMLRLSCETTLKLYALNFCFEHEVAVQIGKLLAIKSVVNMVSTQVISCLERFNSYLYYYCQVTKFA